MMLEGTKEAQELVIGLGRIRPMLRVKLASAGEGKLKEALTHDLNCIRVILDAYESTGKLADLQIDLAKRIIERANAKEQR